MPELATSLIATLPERNLLEQVAWAAGELVSVQVIPRPHADVTSAFGGDA